MGTLGARIRLPVYLEDGNSEERVSVKLGWIGFEGTRIVQRIDLAFLSIEVGLSDLFVFFPVDPLKLPKRTTKSFQWRDTPHHEIVVSTVRRGPVQMISVSERISSHDALVATRSFLQSDLGELVCSPFGSWQLVRSLNCDL